MLIILITIVVVRVVQSWGGVIPVLAPVVSGLVLEAGAQQRLSESSM